MLPLRTAGPSHPFTLHQRPAAVSGGTCETGGQSFLLHGGQLTHLQPLQDYQQLIPEQLIGSLSGQDEPSVSVIC